MIELYALMIIVDTAHILSPMLLTWADRRLRSEARRRWREFVLVPVLVVGAALAVGALTSLGWTDYVPGPQKAFYIGYQWRLHEPFWPRLAHAAWDCIKIPLPLLMLTYVIWQIWHFGSQNFGVVCLCLRKTGRKVRCRRLLRMGCVVGTGALMLPAIIILFRVPQGYLPGRDLLIGVPGRQGSALSSLGVWLSEMALVMVFVPHWLIALWLSAKASGMRQWVWLACIVPAGAAGLLWQVPTSQGALMYSMPWVMAIGVALSLWHYLTDAKLWKLGSPAMERLLAGGKGAFAPSPLFADDLGS